ncbi:hypothetical protein CC1G_08947 [Coprinopsis cinerea okayama7|uniref:DUF6534 domain-containing protein n=1 Tax=Coprinopsis cinerea (strain Okayama-7 / 130 / ATCC MYA-4618 / FGSC 9003) TaxID=240176 RepID=A8P4P8_COPC7|nr:hypothetical protein CC1G_08947 [Coprinopsis cinerea okayama7\|eukprot:XP_001838783.2 hypothetical protein CC1G_08947 [Coprinopsis cinerea okayama7\
MEVYWVLNVTRGIAVSLELRQTLKGLPVASIGPVPFSKLSSPDSPQRATQRHGLEFLTRDTRSLAWTIQCCCDPVLLGGPVFIGSLLAYLLYGALLVQFFHYLCELPSKASWAGPAVAGLVVIVETFSVCFIAQMGWSTVVIPLRGSSVDNLSEFPASSSLNPVLNGLAACVVQLCFAHRIWRLSRSSWGRYVAAIVAFLTASQFADTIVIAFSRLNNRLLDSSKARTMQIIVAVYLGVTLTCDIMITVAMILILRRYKKLTTIHSMKRILNTLTVHTIENGLVTSICAAVNLVLYFARPGDAIHIVFQFIIGKLHANVLLAHLNHQIVVRNAAATETIELSARERAPGTVFSANVAVS